MEKTEIIEDAENLVASALDIARSKVRSDSRLYSIPEWDSLGQLTIMAEIEKRIGRKVEDARTFARLSSVTSVASILVAERAEQVQIQDAHGHPPTPASYYCPDNPIASLVLVHGISADRHEWGFYDLLCLEALNKNIAVLALDYQGHGRSNIPMNDLSLYDIVREIESAHDWMVKRHGGFSMLLGNSFGAGASLIAGVHKGVDLVAMSCAVTNYRADLARVSPDLHLTADGGVPYSNLTLPASVLPEMTQIDETLALLRPEFPVLFFHGAADSDVPCDEAREFAAALPNATFFAFENMDHTFTAPHSQKQRDEATVVNREVAALRIAKELSASVRPRIRH
ncbi:alpha/beta fold hydrolase [Micromonospora sp. NPDC000316]|uniref:alpha/beta fold hydrolase n=1 Tax=Micromonospora sp. NPDC000316 TaxID=3364216 RepID=UPI0036778C34